MSKSLAATMYRQVLKGVQRVDRHYEGNHDHTMRAILGQSWNSQPWIEAGFSTSTTTSSSSGGNITHNNNDQKQKDKVMQLSICPDFTSSESVKIASAFFRMCAKQYTLGKKEESSSSSSSQLVRGQDMNSEMKKVFWVLKQCQNATAASTATTPSSDSAGNNSSNSKKDTSSSASGGDGGSPTGDPSSSEHDLAAAFIEGVTKIEMVGAKPKTFVVKTVVPTLKTHKPLPRHSVPEDPVWMLQTSSVGSNPLNNEMLMMEAAAAAATTPASADGGKKQQTGGIQDVVEYISSHRLSDKRLKQEMQRLSHETINKSPCGNLEIVCRTDYVAAVKRVQPGGGSGMAANEAEYEGSDDAGSPGGGPLGDGVNKAPENAFHYYIAIRNVSDTPTPTAGAEGASTTKSGRPKAKAALNPQVSLNKGKTVTLLSRHWTFVDAETGEVREVTGSGVVGQYPTLAPGESHTYVSGTTLSGKYGYMKGNLQFVVHGDAKNSNASALGGRTGGSASSHPAIPQGSEGLAAEVLPKEVGEAISAKAAAKRKKNGGTSKKDDDVSTSTSSSSTTTSAQDQHETLSQGLELDTVVNAPIAATGLFLNAEASDFVPFGFTHTK